jgi:hypothetical protein
MVDPFGLYKADMHVAATSSGLVESGGFSIRDIEAAAAGNVAMDNWFRSDHWFNKTRVLLHPGAPEHGMGGASNGDILDFINGKVFAAACADKAGDRPRAMGLLGEALHATQDKWAHKNNPNGGGLWRHATGYVGLSGDPDDPGDFPEGFNNAIRDTALVGKGFQQLSSTMTGRACGSR